MTWAGVRALGVLVLWSTGVVVVLVLVLIVADDEVAAVATVGTLTVAGGGVILLQGALRLLVQVHSDSPGPLGRLRTRVAYRWNRVLLTLRIGGRPRGSASAWRARAV